MNIREFIGQYRNHPVLFIGAGISLRYLNNSHTWDGLLKYIAFELKGNNEFYLGKVRISRSFLPKLTR